MDGSLMLFLPHFTDFKKWDPSQEPGGFQLNYYWLKALGKGQPQA